MCVFVSWTANTNYINSAIYIYAHINKHSNCFFVINWFLQLISGIIIINGIVCIGPGAKHLMLICVELEMIFIQC